MYGFFTKLFGLDEPDKNVLMEYEPAPQEGPVGLLEKDTLGGALADRKTTDVDDKAGKRSDYYKFNRLLEAGRPDNAAPGATNLYIKDLNLNSELNGLDKNAVVVDVGSSYSKGTEGLKERSNFKDYQIIGVTPLVFNRKNGIAYTIPVMEGTAETLPTVLQNNKIGEADVILLRNVMEEIYLGEREGADGLVDDSLRGLYNALKPGGKVLIYDQFGTGERGINFYQEYTKKAQELGFRVEECDQAESTQVQGRSKKYLRLIKDNAALVSEQEKPLETHDRQFYLASPDHFVLNAGHTDSEELRPLTHSLQNEGAAIIIEEDGQQYMVLDNEKTANFLAKHQKDQPHAVAAISTLISEELTQFVDPKKNIHALQEGDEDLQRAKGDEELIKDIKEDLEFFETHLRELFTVAPGQQMAICGLIKNPQFQSVITSYIDNYKATPRTKRGIQTSETYGQYLDSILENIKTNLLQQKEQIFACYDQIDLLRERGISLPPQEHLEAITV